MYISKIKIKKLRSIITCWLYFKAAIIYRVFPSIEHNFLWITKFKTIVDIGSNKGQFSLAARKNLKDAKIYAFEPQLKAYNTYKNLFEKDNNAKIYNYAIGQKIRNVTMNISNRDDSSSLLEISNLQNELFPNTYKSTCENIKETNLNEILKKDQIQQPSLLKIDVQGYELEVLKGSLQILDSFSYIYCECSFVTLYSGQSLVPEIMEFMQNYNFEIRGIYNTCFDKYGIAIQSDFLFINKSNVK